MLIVYVIRNTLQNPWNQASIEIWYLQTTPLSSILKKKHFDNEEVY